MSEAMQSDVLKNLVLVILALAILGAIIAGFLYFAIEVPAQAPIVAPCNC